MTDLKTLVTQQAKKGDADALGQMYNTFAPKMRRICARQLGEGNDVIDDLLHDSFVLAYTSLDSLKEAEKLGTWLMAIVRNVTFRYMEVNASKGAQRLSTLQESDLCLLDTSCATDAQILTDEIQAIISELPEGYQKILRLHIFEGYSHQEIGTLLGIAPHSSSSQLARAKQALRRMMRERGMWLIVVLAMLLLPIYRLFVGKEQREKLQTEQGKKIIRKESEPLHNRKDEKTENTLYKQTTPPTSITPHLICIAVTADTALVNDTPSVVKSDDGKTLAETEERDTLYLSPNDTAKVVPHFPLPIYDLADKHDTPVRKHC